MFFYTNQNSLRFSLVDVGHNVSVYHLFLALKIRHRLITSRITWPPTLGGEINSILQKILDILLILDVLEEILIRPIGNFRFP